MILAFNLGATHAGLTDLRADFYDAAGALLETASATFVDRGSGSYRLSYVPGATATDFRLYRDADGVTLLTDTVPATMVGNGARLVTVTVSVGAVPLGGAIVRFTLGAESYSTTTNSSGQALFGLDDGSWTLTCAKSSYTHTPQTVVVDGTEAVAASMSAVSITPAADPLRTTGYVTCYNATGVVATGITITVQLIRTADGTAGLSHSDIEQTGTSDAGGLVQIANLLRGATYRARRGDNRWTSPFVAASAATSALPEILGHE